MKFYLNTEQKHAIVHEKGPLLIIAGAGTGKTTVITERIKHLIVNKKVPTEHILALTFTEKAAREMEERVDIALPYGYTELWLSTFHAFCDRILKREALSIGLDPGYHLLNQAEAIDLFRQHLFSMDLSYYRPRGNPNKFIQGMLVHFARLHDEDITPFDYLTWVSKKRRDTKKSPDEELKKWEELARAYEAYEQIKVKNSVMDFSDLIAHTLYLFRKRPAILNHYRNQFHHVLIDEFQDTNIAQYELIKLLAPPKQLPNICVVGDDSQSIYKFRGAAVSNILSFMNDYPEARQIILTKNYRSTQTILDHAYTLIKHNDPDTLEARLGISKLLEKTRNVEESNIELMYVNRVEEETEEIVKKISSLRALERSNTESYHWNDFAVLIRANNHAEPFISALKRAGIPYQFLGPGILFKQREVKDLIAYLKFLHDISDSISLYRVLSMDIWNLSGRDSAALLTFAKKYNLTLLEACEQIGSPVQFSAVQYQLPFISSNARTTLTIFISMVHRHLDHIARDTAGQILYYFLEDSGLLKQLAEFKTAKDEKIATNISRFFSKLKSYEIDHEDASVHAVNNWLDLSIELGESPFAGDTDWTENDAVNILTVHSSKGLEFPVVFLVNLITGRFPTYDRKEQIPIPDELIKEELPQGDFHIEEERRLFYVGMTRARDRLYLSASKYYSGGKRERKLSSFVIEAIGSDAVKNYESYISTVKNQLSFLDYVKPQDQEISKNKDKIRTEVHYLSYSQIETFNMCPLKYKYRYILKIPIPPVASASFGQSVHETLRAFYELVKRGEKVNNTTLVDLLSKKWIPLGYKSKAHEIQAKKEGITMLNSFYKNGFDPLIIPNSLEQFFVVRIEPQLKIAGKIDRVDIKNNGLEIIDYKTGRIPSQKEIDNSLQMTVYALAATDPGIFGFSADHVLLTFYFLGEDKRMSTTRTQNQLEKAKLILKEKAEEIGESKFLPRVGKHCDFCEFKPICPKWEE